MNLTDELDERLEALLSEYDWNDVFNVPANDVLEEKAPKKEKEDDRTIKLCTWHTWIMYRGFLDSFEYCKECGIKREGLL